MARSFVDANDDLLDVASTPVGLTTYPLTMFAWVYPTVAASDRIIEWGDEGNPESVCFLGTAVSGSNVDLSFGSPTAGTIITPNDRAVNSWYAVTGRVDGSGNTTLDQGSSGSNQATGSGATFPTDLDSFTIGASTRFGNGSRLDGYIAEVALWDVELTDDEVNALADKVSPRMIRSNALVFYAPLIRDEGSGNAKDIVGGLVLTPGGTGTPGTVDHPPVYYPSRLNLGVPAAAAATEIIHTDFTSTPIIVSHDEVYAY